MTDEELVYKAQQGDDISVNTLLSKYKSLVNKLARSYFLIGGDMEDIIQEGMIGLYKAIKHFTLNKNASFKTFASTCIKHQIQNAIKIASSEKNKVLSTAIPIFEQTDFDDEDDIKEIFLPSDLPTPDDKLIEKEQLEEIKNKIIDKLSNLEFKVLTLYLQGYSYNEIAKLGKLNKKSIDNALSRIKNKLSFLKNDN